VFTERFAVLYAEAGDPPLRQVSAAVGRAHSIDKSGRAVRVSVQRVSDWRSGRNVPARFAALAAVLTVLIGQARKAQPRPCLEGLYDLGTWRRLWEEALASPIAPVKGRLDEHPPTSGESGVTLDPGDTGVCPYKGLAAFSEQDALWFFGRERSTATLLARLGDALDGRGIIMLVGASGAGKSSLINAGLLPALTHGALTMGSESWPVVVMTPGADPLGELVRNVPDLAETLDTAQNATRATVAETDTDPTERGQDEDVLEGPGSIPASQFASRVRTACAAHLARTTGENTRLVVVVDQFEEAFTLGGSEQRRRLFVRILDAASTPEDSGGIVPALVVVVLRADFYSRCLDYPELASALQDRQMVLGPMTAQEVRAVIMRPAQAEDLSLEPGLVELLLRELGVAEDAADQAAGYDPGALPLLAHALRATWHQREGQTLTVAGYRRTGGIRQALATTAERAYTQLNPAEQQIARGVLLRLVNISDQGGSGDTRRRVPRAHLLQACPLPGSTQAVEAVLEAFGRARLLTFDTTSVEITHEALLRAWPRLRQWIDTDRAGNLTRQELEQAAAVWDREGRDTAGLYQGGRLETARSWAACQPNKGELSPAASAFLAASTTQQRRTAQLRRAVLVVLSVLALLASGAAALAVQQRDTAQSERDTAIFNQITAQADRLRSTDISLAAQLDLTAYRMRPTTDLYTALLTDASTALSTPLTGHTDTVTAVAFSPDGRTLATGSFDRTVRLWNVADPAHPAALGTPLGGHTDTVRAVAFSPDGRTLATGSDDHTVRLWNVADPAHPAALGTPLSGHTNAVYAVVFSPDGRTLATGSDDHTVRLWNVADPAHPAALGTPLSGHTDTVYAVVFSPDGRTLATGSHDGTVRLWNVAEPTHPAALGLPLGGHTDTVYAVAFSPDGRTLATGSADGMGRLWNVADPAHPAALGPPLSGHTNGVTTVAFSPDGRTLATGSFDRTVRLWNVADPAHPAALGPPLSGHTNAIYAVAFSPDGRTLATSSFDRTVRLWNIPSALLSGHTNTVYAVAFSPDGRTLATSSADRTVRLWNVADPTHPAALGPPLTGHTNGVTTVAFSPDGRTLATGSFDHTVRLWNVADPTHPAALGPPLTSHTNTVYAVVFSPDGRTLATGSHDGTVRLWNVAEPTHPAALGPPLRGHTDTVYTVAFSPDGRTLATSSFDQTVRLWNVADPTHPAALGPPLGGHTNTVYAVAFSPDGRTLATSSADRTVRLWNVADPTHPAALGTPLSGHTDTVYTVAFSPDGRTLATGSADHTVRLWRTNVNQAIQRICATTGHTLTPATWKQHVSSDLPYQPPCPVKEGL
jgi:uncharacterized delta-60 repeat protein